MCVCLGCFTEFLGMMSFPKTWWAVIALVLAAGAFVFSTIVTSPEPLTFLESLHLLEPADSRPQVVLTGKDKAGHLEVPVINLWERPGFGRDNQVAARVHLPVEGEVTGRVNSEIEVAGLTWHEVEVGRARGWVIGRFVVE